MLFFQQLAATDATLVQRRNVTTRYYERLQRKGLTYAGYDAWLKEEQDMITDIRDLTGKDQ